MAIDPYRISACEIPHRIDTYSIEPPYIKGACEIHYRINPYRIDPYKILPPKHHIE